MPLAIVGATACLLTSCVPTLPIDRDTSDLAIRFSASGTEIAFCEAAFVGHLFAEVRNENAGLDWHRFFDATTKTRVTTGTVLDLDDLPGDFVVQANESPQIGVGAEVSIVSVPPADSDDRELAASFFVTADTPSGGWIHPDGSNTIDACSEG
jgi:hypothetical protein